MSNNPRPLHFTRPDRSFPVTDSCPGDNRYAGAAFASAKRTAYPDSTRRQPANVADQFEDLLQHLTPQARIGMVVQLTRGFYDGWRPTRREMADLVAVELGILGVEESLARQRMRRSGQEPTEDILTRVLHHDPAHGSGGSSGSGPAT